MPKVTRSLPDDAVMEILSRMPANDVSRFKRVCQRWNSLISTQHFANVHMKHSNSPVNFVQEKIYTLTTRFFLLDKWEPPRKNMRVGGAFCPNSVLSPDIIRDRVFSFCLSHDGFILISSSHGQTRTKDFIVFNPITRDQVRVIFNSIYDVVILAMFFHPLIKEYCILLMLLKDWNVRRYIMLNLGSQPICKDINPPPSFLLFFCCHQTSPVVIDEDATVYRLLLYKYNTYKGQIMAFDIRAEEFTFMPYPDPTDDCIDEIHISILKVDGRLSFVRTTTTTSALMFDFWGLKDFATRLWIKNPSVSISINVYQLVNISWFSRGVYFAAMTIVNGELLLKCSHIVSPLNYKDGRLILACDLTMGSVRKIGRKYRECILSTYMPSFVSLKNCRSEIRIYLEDFSKELQVRN